MEVTTKTIRTDAKKKYMLKGQSGSLIFNESTLLAVVDLKSFLWMVKNLSVTEPFFGGVLISFAFQALKFELWGRVDLGWYCCKIVMALIMMISKLLCALYH